ncbi:hypothetical protein [Agromyces cerinus]|uniref:Uncharacterized protein n=1 Tax=Agromyces cerinus subsp. cerinus TaxID=232089 RepID=A0A1N6DWB0_9MICO|nr:hypothetical protein [Agromyces cerinus]SIN75085.1 hypothetical protein SAMN05443544_0815 [Agromyces cerinus subsp. cerinus]
MSDPEITPSWTADDSGGKSDDRRMLSDNVTVPAETQIEDETVAVGGTQSAGNDDE